MNFTHEHPIISESKLTLNNVHVVGSLYFINFVLALPTNSYVVYLIVSGSGSGVASEFFSLNLSICEILFNLSAVVVLPAYVFPYLISGLLFLTGLPATGRPFFQCLICIERYIAVVHPILFLKLKPLKYKLVCCISVWTVIIGFCVFSMSILSSDLNVFFYVLSPLYLLLLSIKVLCCLSVFMVLRKSGPGEWTKEKAEANHVKRRAIKTILTITVTMIINYFPLVFLRILQRFTQTEISLQLWFIGFALFVLTGFVPPVLYIHICSVWAPTSQDTHTDTITLTLYCRQLTYTACFWTVGGNQRKALRATPGSSPGPSRCEAA